MKHEFSINILFLLIINLLIKPAYIFGIEAQVQNMVGIQNYGLYFAYFNFVFLFQFINDPGLQNWNAQYVPKNKHSINDHLPNVFATKLLLAFSFIAIVLVCGYWLGFDRYHLIFMLCINLILSSIFMIMRTTISGLGYYRLDTYISALDKILMIAIIGAMILFLRGDQSFSIMTFVYGQCMSYAIACIIVGVMIFTKVNLHFYNISMANVKKILASSLPYVLTLIFMTAYNKLDGIMLSHMIADNNYQAGLYASAYRFYDAANMIGYLFAALLLPMFGANIYNTDILKELKIIGFRYVSVSAILIICVIFFYGDNILSYLYKQYEESFTLVLKILIVSYLAVAIAYIFGTLLVAAGKIRNLNIVFGIGLFINILFNLLMIPTYGAIGAALATLLTQSIVMIGQIYLVRKEMGINLDVREIYKPMQFTVITIIVFYLVERFFFTAWVYNLMASILFCVLLSFIFKIIDKQDFIILKDKK